MVKDMRILIIRTFPSYMEVKRNTYNIQEVGLAKALVRSGNTCDIVFWTDKEEKNEVVDFDESSSITVFYRHGKAILKNAIYTGLDSLIEKYDIVQLSEYNQLYSWMLARKFPNKTVIYHGPYYSPFNKRYNLMCKFVDKLVIPTYKKLGTYFLVKSRLAYDFLLSKGLSEKQIVVAGVGVDLDAFKIEDMNDIPKEVLDIKKNDNKLKLLYIGRIEPRRNTIFLIDILHKFVQNDIPAELILIGNGDEEYCKKCFDYAEELAVKDKIYWIKKVEQKYLSYAYENTDVFLLPTYYEIFGMVLLEAMYFGKPVITTKNGGSEMLITHGEDGCIIDDFDAEKWYEAIVNIRDNREIGKFAHEKIVENFTWDKLCQIFVNIYAKRIDRE